MNRVKFQNLFIQSLLILCALFTSQNLLASELQSYIDKGDIKVSVELDSDKVVPREQVQATLEIVSKYPLKDEIVLPYLNVDNGIVKSDEQGVLRSSKMVDGERWYSQSTKIYVYPMQQGRFVLPSFDVAVTLLDDKTSVSGAIQTPEAGFDVTASGSQLEYVAGSAASFTVTGASEEELESGDAVTLTYVLSVKDSHTMLLPEFKAAEIAGAERYVKPLQKENQYNRLSKSNTAILTQEVTYIFPNEGHFTVPSQTVQWWETESKSMKTLELDQQVFVVGTPSLLSSLPKLDQIWVYALLGVIALLWALKLAFNKIKRVPRLTSKQTKVPLSKLFLNAVKHKEYDKAINLARELSQVKGVELERFPLWQEMLEQTYSKSNEGFTHEKAMELLRLMSTVPSKQKTSFKFDWRLNPH
ncbi:hypothetical protein JCM19231_4733 [Vibrio ishigakensis]|uniref:BatD protein n=1 Tax=Vibrio ishigakensis TaxID=1481914 RepID=A0A0B8P7P5_9VIBR|nr:hypothetical protein [Vibrio ishigakensis]GAM59268.1 hypothetical protein JCM19231_4733 [Vibrio ishigakensis]